MRLAILPGREDPPFKNVCKNQYAPRPANAAVEAFAEFEFAVIVLPLKFNGFIIAHFFFCVDERIRRKLVVKQAVKSCF